jgi:hypothetical protein
MPAVKKSTKSARAAAARKPLKSKVKPKPAPKKVKAVKAVVKPKAKAKPIKPVKAVVKVAVKVAPPAKKVRIELWSYDEFNQGSIVASGFDLAQIIKSAKAIVTEENCGNSLAAGEIEKHWTTYFPELSLGKTPILYGGNKRNGQHSAYVQEDGAWKNVPLPPQAKIRHFLGNVRYRNEVTPWYLADFRGNEINTLNSQFLESKTVLFIKVVG